MNYEKFKSRVHVYLNNNNPSEELQERIRRIKEIKLVKISLL